MCPPPPHSGYCAACPWWTVFPLKPLGRINPFSSEFPFLSDVWPQQQVKQLRHIVWKAGHPLTTICATSLSLAVLGLSPGVETQEDSMVCTGFIS